MAGKVGGEIEGIMQAVEVDGKQFDSGAGWGSN